MLLQIRIIPLLCRLSKLLVKINCNLETFLEIISHLINNNKMPKEYKVWCHRRPRPTLPLKLKRKQVVQVSRRLRRKLKVSLQRKVLLRLKQKRILRPRLKQKQPVKHKLIYILKLKPYRMIK